MKNKNFIVTIILGILFFIAIVYSTILFYSTLTDELGKSVKTTLVDMANQQQLALNRQLESMVYSLATIAETLPIIGVDEAGILEYIEQKQEALNYETVFIVDDLGSAFLSTGKLTDVSQSDFYKSTINGTTYVSQQYTSEYTDKEVILVAVPIYVEGKIDGVLAVEYCTDYLRTLLTTFTDERGLNLVIDADSNIILSTNSFVLSFEAFQNAEFDDGITFEDVVQDFKDRKSGSISYTLNGSAKFGEYRPIEINDWMLFFEISEESMNQSVRNVSNSMILVITLIFILAFITITYIVISKNNSAKKLKKVAYYDELTGIPNLVRFKMLVSDVIKKNPNKTYTMVKMDLVNFKAINEVFGFDEGNNVIRAIADIGKTVVDESFIQARVSSEEFMLFSESKLFEHLDSSSKAFEARFKALLPQLQEHKFTFRYGRYFLKLGENDVNDVVNKTNIAHSFAKTDSINNIWDYDENFTKKVLRDTEIANKMHKALENKEFKVFLQPKYGVSSKIIVGAEALVRWVEADGNMIFPNEFIPLFEQNGFIVELDKYMLKNVCATLKSWSENKKECIPISVNFSRIHMRNKNFVSELSEIVSAFEINPKYIEVELTESTVLENEKELKILLTQLQGAGFLVSIDDFGSGYSSLGMLKNFKVNTLKLDRSFFIEVEDESEHQRGEIVVENIIKLANELGMYTVAEGIEEEHQHEFLKRINCDAAQGYLFSRPITISDFEDLYFNS